MKVEPIIKEYEVKRNDVRNPPIGKPEMQDGCDLQECGNDLFIGDRLLLPAHRDTFAKGTIYVLVPTPGRHTPSRSKSVLQREGIMSIPQP
jgi:hypothetical protein